MLRRKPPSSLLARLVGARRRGRRPAVPPRAQALLAALVALGAAGAAFLRLRRRGGPADLRAAPGSAPSREAATKVVQQQWTCQCGQDYRVSGEGRHRIYWLPDAPVSDPVTSGRCARCERELPGDQASPVDEEASA